jgi:hypothetical protein
MGETIAMPLLGWMESKEIVMYKRYVDGILIMYDQTKTDETTIHNTINNINENLEFKITAEEKHTISYLDLSINRKPNRIELDFYRNPTHIWTLLYIFHPTTHTTISWRLLDIISTG